jgi:hypothetical protein
MNRIMSGWKGWVTAGLWLLLRAATCQVPGAVVTTLVQDTIYRADGTPAGGTVLLSWGAFTTAGGESIAAGSTSVTLGTGGALSVALAPNAGATPMGSFYTALLHLNDGTSSKQFWIVPLPLPGVAAVRLASIQNQVLPTSVAMQTVSKQYVDAAIARAITGYPLDASPYVLNLPSDPTSALQAADKNYVDESIASLSAGAVLLGGAVTAANFSINQTCAGGTGTGVTPASIMDVAGTDANHTLRFILGSGAVAPTGTCVLFTMTYTQPKGHVSFPLASNGVNISDQQAGIACQFSGDCSATAYSYRALAALASSTQIYLQVFAP